MCNPHIEETDISYLLSLTAVGSEYLYIQHEYLYIQQLLLIRSSTWEEMLKEDKYDEV